jgi:protocatechuate 3,4-dioxygenase beta subunit
MNDREKDDSQTGRFLSRREVFAYLGVAAGAAIINPEKSSWAAGTPLPVCIGRPEQTEGPYFIDENLNRSDIRSDPSDGSVKEGTPLKILFHVLRVTPRECAPFKGAIVDVWHCDAAGIYSGVRDRNFSTIGKKYLRGCQLTDENGDARFVTIYPGWYSGRTVHIHFKIRNTDRGNFEFTSQLYFDDSLSDQVFSQAPYLRNGRRLTRNENDFIFHSGGKDLMLSPVKEGNGYSAVFEIGFPLS